MKNPKTIINAVIEILKIPEKNSIYVLGVDPAKGTGENYDDVDNLKNNDPLHFHHTAGRKIRNNWNLWNLWDKESSLHKDFNSIGIYHPDDMSGILFDTAHRILNSEPVDLKGQVKFYQDYWKNMKVNPRIS